VGGAAKRERLDDSPVSQSAGDIAGSRSLTPGSDGKFGSGVELGLDCAQASHDAFDRLVADRLEQLLLHAPGEGLRPGE